MNKTDLIRYVSDKTLITEKDSGIIIDVFLDGIKEGLFQGQRVKIQDFGSFFLQGRKPRTALNPRNQNMINVPAKKVIKFKSSLKLHERVNENSLYG